jgi:hypothetical protein
LVLRAEWRAPPCLVTPASNGSNKESDGTRRHRVVAVYHRIRARRHPSTRDCGERLMSQTYTCDQISEAVNAGADLVLSEFDLGDRDMDLLNLVVNAAMTVLDKPDADMDYVAAECYSEPLDEIKSWWDFS